MRMGEGDFRSPTEGGPNRGFHRLSLLQQYSRIGDIATLTGKKIAISRKNQRNCGLLLNVVEPKEW
jgi:hypothetical protein